MRHEPKIFAEIYLDLLCPPDASASIKRAVKQHFVMGFATGVDAATLGLNPAQFRASLADLKVEAPKPKIQLVTRKED